MTPLAKPDGVIYLNDYWQRYLVRHTGRLPSSDWFYQRVSGRPSLMSIKLMPVLVFCWCSVSLPYFIHRMTTPVQLANDDNLSRTQIRTPVRPAGR